MKKVFFSLAFMLISLFAFANNTNLMSLKISENSIFKNDSQDVIIKYTINNKTVEIKKSFSSINSETLNFIDSELLKINEIINNSNNLRPICSITVSVGFGSNYVSATITGDCATIVARAIALKKEITKAFF